jgi:hypothetical protein
METLQAIMELKCHTCAQKNLLEISRLILSGWNTDSINFDGMAGNMTVSASFDPPVLFVSQKQSNGPGTPSRERKASIHFARWKNASSTQAKCG